MTLINPDESKARVSDGEPSAAIKVKEPKRILHFSDGILEEYSTDEEDSTPKQEELVDPVSLLFAR